MLAVTSRALTVTGSNMERLLSRQGTGGRKSSSSKQEGRGKESVHVPRKVLHDRPLAVSPSDVMVAGSLLAIGKQYCQPVIQCCFRQNETSISFLTSLENLTSADTFSSLAYKRYLSFR